MLSKLARFLLTASSVAPVCFTLAFIGYINKDIVLLFSSLSLGIISTLLCFWFLRFAKKKLSIQTKTLTSATPANKEVTNYFLTYLFPLLGTQTVFIDWRMSVFFYLCLFFYISFSESYSFNPLISLLGYKFYEAEDNTGVGFVLLSKTPILDANEITISVKKLTDHIYIIYD